MTSGRLTIGAFVSIDKDQLQTLLECLQQVGYRTIGPQVRDGAVVYDDLASVNQLPVGQIDIQDGGHYRLEADESAGWFDYVVGPHSLKNFLFPARETIQQLTLQDGSWASTTPEVEGPPLAVIGVRGCDLNALKIQDRVFLEGPYVDPHYQARRERLFVVAVNCRRAAATCFCHSMGAGPAVSPGFDLALTEFTDRFVVEVGTDRGGEAMKTVPATLCSVEDIQTAKDVPKQLEKQMHARKPEDGHPQPRELDTTGIKELLLGNLQHPRWDDVAERCLACANCTMVCPTCFCSTVGEVTDLTNENVLRERTWASCFTGDHSYTSGGVVRPSVKSQYRQWLTHKLASWIDQFDSSGCVGCGRCITWCPVGIDITEEVAAIRGEDI
ncbi:MAG: 4Fe-4S dicluster domain-containing protein [Planctomycetaceae bacterium]|nr:4Fe-4S dicluster domain-containing protein [Planctomycetaceae bacterium]